MIEYQNLKLESKYSNKYQKTVQDLYLLMKRYNKKISIQSILNNIKKSTNPVELIKIFIKDSLLT